MDELIWKKAITRQKPTTLANKNKRDIANRCERMVGKKILAAKFGGCFLGAREEKAYTSLRAHAFAICTFKETWKINDLNSRNLELHIITNNKIFLFSSHSLSLSLCFFCSINRHVLYLYCCCPIWLSDMYTHTRARTHALYLHFVWYRFASNAVLNEFYAIETHCVWTEWLAREHPNGLHFGTGAQQKISSVSAIVLSLWKQPFGYFCLHVVDANIQDSTQSYSDHTTMHHSWKNMSPKI